MEKSRFKIIRGNTGELLEQALNTMDKDYAMVGNVFVLPNRQAGPHGYEIMQLVELKEFTVPKRAKISAP